MIRVHNLSKSYLSGTPVLDNVSMELATGTLGVIVGRSGSGKSTLLNILAGLDKSDSGVVEVRGQELSKMDAEQLASFRLNHLGIVFQFFNLLPTLTLLQNVEIPAQLAQRRMSEISKRARELLESVQIDSRTMSRLPHEVSGGEIQRTAIARALINNPQLILADEPTGNLDQRSGESVIQIFKDLVSSGLTVLVVTHEKEVVNSADTVFRLLDGKIAS